MAKKDFRVDCVISAGVLDKKGHMFLEDENRVYEVVRHNVPYSEFEKWLDSAECRERLQKLRDEGRKRFGFRYCVNAYCTDPQTDNKKEAK